MKIHLTIGKKLAVGVIALIACLLALSLTSLWVISKLGTSLDSAVNGTAKKLDLLASTREGFQQLKATSTREHVAFAIGELARRSPNGAQWTCTACHVASSTEDTLHDIRASAGGVQQHAAELRSLVSDESEIKALNTLDHGATQWVGYTEGYLRLASSNHFEDAHAILRDQMFPLVEDTDKAAAVLTQKERAELNASNQQAKIDISRGRWAVFTVICINLFVAFILLWLVREITSRLRLMAAELDSSAREVAAMATQTSSTSQSLAQGTSEQAASLEETSASSEEIRSISCRSANHLRSAAEVMTESRKDFSQTETALGDMVAAMAEINAQSGKIAKIIKVIDEIAFQTNILALNAAVEAARAGEAGTGFAVVADEVRNLAQRSAQAAKDTTTLIEESIAKSEDGKEKVNQVTAAIHKITEQTTKVKALVDEANSESQEQSRGIEEIVKAISQMEQVTQQSAANSEQGAAAAEELSSQSESLQEIAQQLTFMVDGRDL
jgi:methyl-accepting chemotaxis protein/methyl-accepting chemotaxis protein-1 (serine sensor receptor)